MSRRDRLIDATESEFERLLLRAGRESPPRGAKDRALLAATAALAASAGVAATTAGAAGAAAGTSTALGGKASLSALGAFFSLKTVAVAAAVSVGVAGASAVVVHAASVRHDAVSASAASPKARAAAPVPAASALVVPKDPSLGPAPGDPAVPPLAAAPVAPTAAALPRFTSSTSSTRAPEVAPAPALRATSVASAQGETCARPPCGIAAASEGALRPNGSAVASISGSSAAAELVLLDRARSAIAAGNPGGGLVVLDEYAAEFPRGVMAPEASVLRIEALAAAGDHARAKRVAIDFLGANPSSPYAARIESVVGPTNE
jgi:hypothetical protein